MPLKTSAPQHSSARKPQRRGSAPSNAPARVRGLLKTLLFGALVCAMVFVLSVLFTPTGERFGDAKDTIRGLYDQPAESVEVMAVGASTMRWGFSPDYLYKEYGIRAYDCCTSAQAPMVGYYLLQEALRVQGSSIRLALIDMGPYVKGKNFFKSTDVERAIINMDPSKIKYELIEDLLKNYPEVRRSEQYVPLLRYHERWNELESADFESLLGNDYDTYAHGQNLSFESNATRGTAGKHTTEKNDAITPEIDTDKDDIEALYDDVSLSYLDKIIELCADNEVQGLFMKTPASMWTDARHDACANLAKRYDVPLLDMSLPEIRDACGVDYDLDYYDSKHANILGSLKITGYLGSYLHDNFDLTDARGSAADEEMEADLQRYEQAVQDAQLARSSTLEAYLDLLSESKGRYTVFATVKGEAADALTPEARAKLEQLGLDGLAALEHGQSYAGVLDGGACVGQKTGTSGKEVTLSGAYRDGQVLLKKTSMQAGAVLDDPLVLVSAARDGQAHTDIMLDGEDLSESAPGINFVVYNRETNTLLDTSAFNTHTGSARSSDLAASA